MTKLIYCKNCILPNTRPNLYLNKLTNLCSVCVSLKNNKGKNKINWSKRERQFKLLVKNNSKKNKVYDCIIPVSGGKDSTWQVLTALKYKLRPLCITWKSPARNKIGQKI